MQYLRIRNNMFLSSLKCYDFIGKRHANDKLKKTTCACRAYCFVVTTISVFLF